MGATQASQSWLRITHRSGRPVDVPDGAVSSDARIWGCYLHGLFANQQFRRAWLASLGWTLQAAPLNTATSIELAFDRLADEVAEALDIDWLDGLIEEQM